MTSEQIIRQYNLVIEGQTASNGDVVKLVGRDGVLINRIPEASLDDWLQVYHHEQQEAAMTDN